MENNLWLTNYDIGISYTAQICYQTNMTGVVDESAEDRQCRAVFKGSKILCEDFVHISNSLASGLAA